MTLVWGCGARTTLDDAYDPGAGQAGVQCGVVHCGDDQLCVHCPGDSATCAPPAAEASFCDGAMLVECDDPSDCSSGNHCVFDLSVSGGRARCASLDLACTEPGCARVCANTDDCYGGELCAAAPLKYGSIDVCQPATSRSMASSPPAAP